MLLALSVQPAAQFTFLDPPLCIEFELVTLFLSILVVLRTEAGATRVTEKHSADEIQHWPWVKSASNSSFLMDICQPERLVCQSMLETLLCPFF